MDGAKAPGTVLDGEYRLVREIGVGSMCAVWEGVHERTGRRVAVKRLLAPRFELRHGLLREARACGRLSHRNIVALQDVGETAEGDPFLVMELLQGQTLAELLKERRRLEPAQATRIGHGVASALAAVHAAGIVHRDLKPANIFLHREEGMAEGDFVVKLFGFGVSKILGETQGAATMTGAVVGGPAYPSPEQVGMRRDLDHRSDLWSLGMVLFEMLTGERVFKGNVDEVVRSLLSGPIPRVSDKVRSIPPHLDALVARCLERDRSKRIQSAEELARLLSAPA